MEDNGQATGAGRGLKQGFERFSVLSHQRRTRSGARGFERSGVWLRRPR
jgi:hypothetical protein